MTEVQPLLDTINSEGAELSEVTPGDASLRVEDLIHKDNKRFDNLREQIEKRAEKARLVREKSSEVWVSLFWVLACLHCCRPLRLEGKIERVSLTATVDLYSCKGK